jgi:DNA repair photolyase
MRWDEQKADREEERRLPGLAGATGVVRSFDAPEALGVRFHEVEAKSALNRVPGSYLPFNWTVNPYRGCSHACTYCQAGDTPILMGDGRTKPLADLRVGDRIYGTVRRGNYRRYAVTEVLAHWESYKQAYRVALEDGTELIASGDHRFLSNRGWKHVKGSDQGAFRRPYLTTNNELLGTGQFAAKPADSPEYRRGYLCGLIRGDGHVGSYSYKRPGRTHGDVHRFRLALTDFEPLRRAQEYLKGLDIATDEFEFLAAAGTHRAMTAIRTSARDRVVAVKDAIHWSRHATQDWSRGFLAGIFDAEGSYSRGILRISNTDEEIIDRLGAGLQELGLPFVFDRIDKPNGLMCVRLTGGVQNHLRFFHTVDPATTRKRSIEGKAIKNKADLGVASVEPLGKEIDLFDITTGTGDFIANGVVSHNCFARASHTYLDLNAGEDFEREIIVKVNVPELLRAELARPSWKRELVAFGTNTDPYQWVEGRYELMRPMLEAIRDTATPTSVLSKSPLVLRDLDLFEDIADVADVSVNLSVPTIDEKAWRETEPHTPHPRKRIEAVAELNAAGIPSGVLIAPLMPGINDSPEQVEEIARLCEDAGATFISGMGLHLRPHVREVFMGWLRQARPDLVETYERLYDGRAYLEKDEQRRLSGLVPAKARGKRRRRRGGETDSASKPAPEPVQARLF